MVEILSELLPEVKKIPLKVYRDERGFFTETYHQPRYFEKEIPDFVQDNHSFSVKDTIRGMHFQSGLGQAKLITVVLGTIFDVFVDIRPSSKTFGKWGSYLLDAGMHEQLFIPEGFAHGFAALSDTHVIYKVSTVFDPNKEKNFRYDDPEVGIVWPIDCPILSERDRFAPNLHEAIR